MVMKLIWYLRLLQRGFKKLSDEEQEDLMEELSAHVTKHVKMSRTKKGNLFRVTL